MSIPSKRITCDGKTFWNMPSIGLGTYKLKGKQCQDIVQHALATGYRHIDTAECYKNYDAIGNAIQLMKQNNNESKHEDTDSVITIERKDIFIVSKLSPRSMQSEKKVESAIINCLQSLQTDYIDLFLIHWPGVSGKKTSDVKLPQLRLMAWKMLEKYVNKGSIRCIGVSNFEVKHLKPLIDGYNNGDLQYKPAVNQIEFHPYYQRYDIFEFCHQHGIQMEAYGSLGAAESYKKENMKNGRHVLLHHPVVTQMSDKHEKTAAQILLRYGLDHEYVVIPKSSKYERLQENINVFDFELDRNDIKLMDDIASNGSRKFAWDPSQIC